MAEVIGALTMSLDGSIAHEDYRVGHRFNWYWGNPRHVVPWTDNRGPLSRTQPPLLAHDGQAAPLPLRSARPTFGRVADTRRVVQGGQTGRHYPNGHPYPGVQ